MDSQLQGESRNGTSKPLPMKRIWVARFRRGVLYVLVAVTAWSYLWFPEYEKRVRMERRVTDLQEEIAELQQNIVYNSTRIALLKDDPMTVESEIRRNLRWVRPGEIPARIEQQVER